MTDGSDSVAAGTVILTNSTRQERTATVTVIDDAGHTAQDKVTIGALATSTVGVSNQLSGGTWLMAQVLVDGGGVMASEQVAGSQGRTLSACGSRTSSTWQFTGGSTQRGQALTISLANPTATPAVANVSFITANAGAATPQGSQGLVVGPHAVVAVPVQNLVAHGADLASDVTVTQGRLVAFATQVSSSPVGVGVALGQPQLVGPCTAGGVAWSDDHHRHGQSDLDLTGRGGPSSDPIWMAGSMAPGRRPVHRLVAPDLSDQSCAEHRRGGGQGARERTRGQRLRHHPGGWGVERWVGIDTTPGAAQGSEHRPRPQGPWSRS